MNPAQEPMDLVEFKNAIHAWCSDATSLETIWTATSAPVPKYPYAALNIISGPLPVSSVWELRHTFDASRVGEEVEFTSCVPCTFSISAQFYVTLDALRNPACTSLQYATRAQAALTLPSYRAAFNAAKIAVIDTGNITNIDEVFADAFISRSNLDIVLGTPLNITEYETYIEKVEIQSANLGIDMEVSL